MKSGEILSVRDGLFSNRCKPFYVGKICIQGCKWYLSLFVICLICVIINSEISCTEDVGLFENFIFRIESVSCLYCMGNEVVLFHIASSFDSYMVIQLNLFSEHSTFVSEFLEIYSPSPRT